jgi:hypothetical protein
MGYYKPPDECYSYNEETGETSSCFNTTLSMYEYDDTANFADGNDMTNFTDDNDTTKRRKRQASDGNETTETTIITFSQLQLNPKVRSDMNYLHWYALGHGNLTMIEMYEKTLENITEFIEVWYCQSYQVYFTNFGSTDFVSLNYRLLLRWCLTITRLFGLLISRLC